MKTISRIIREVVLEHKENCDCLCCRKGGKIDQAELAIREAVKGMVEVDEFKVAQILAKKEYCGEKCAEAAHALSQADIIKWRNDEKFNED